MEQRHFAGYCKYKSDTKRREKERKIGLHLIGFMEIYILHKTYISDKREICIMAYTISETVKFYNSITNKISSLTNLISCDINVFAHKMEISLFATFSNNCPFDKTQFDHRIVFLILNADRRVIFLS